MPKIDNGVVEAPFRTLAALVLKQGAVISDSIQLQTFYPKSDEGQSEGIWFPPGDASTMLKQIKRWLDRFEKRTDIAKWLVEEAKNVRHEIGRLEAMLCGNQNAAMVATVAVKLGAMLQWVAASPMDIRAQQDKKRMRRLDHGFKQHFADTPQKRVQARTLYRLLKSERPFAKATQLHEEIATKLGIGARQIRNYLRERPAEKTAELS